MLIELRAEINKALGIIKNVRVLEKGIARGHNLLVDDESLQTALQAAQANPGGVRVKVDHGTGAAALVGYLTAFRIQEKTLFADLHLLKSAPQRDLIIEVAETNPALLGLSIAFDMTPEGEASGTVRVARLRSVDVVDLPAATSALLCEPQTPAPSPVAEAPKADAPTPALTEKEVAMNKEEILAALNECMKPVNETLSSIKAFLDKAVAPVPTIDEEAMSEKLSEKVSAKLSAHLSAAKGADPVPAAPSEPAKTAFEIFSSLKGVERTRYFNQNADAIRASRK
jgi:hypothetical protein